MDLLLEHLLTFFANIFKLSKIEITPEQTIMSNFPKNFIFELKFNFLKEIFFDTFFFNL